jgi:hypothetical protein
MDPNFKHAGTLKLYRARRKNSLRSTRNKNKIAFHEITYKLARNIGGFIERVPMNRILKLDALEVITVNFGSFVVFYSSQG